MSATRSERHPTARRDGAVAAVAAAFAVALTAWSCGGAETGPKAVQQTDTRPTGISKDDRSRCDFRGRADREVTESAGPGSVTHNIRRVYALLGDGEDRKKILICREVDTNLDGVKDVMRTYNERGEALNETADTDFDGRIDTWVTFTRGRIAKIQLDNTRNGEADETRLYISGKLSRVQIDSNDDGKTDVWEIYDDGKLQRRGVDLDHDGRVDRWDRDEIALREINERERREEEEAEKKAKEAEEAKKREQALDGGVTDARVSARRRE
jgi:hypothetical protein